MKEIPILKNMWNDPSVTAYRAAEKICTQFERPQNKEKKGRTRGEWARAAQKNYRPS